MKNMKILVIIGITVLCVLTLFSGISLSGVEGSRHDLRSMFGAGGFLFEQPMDAEQVCVFCHAPHSANRFIWQRTVVNGTTAGGGLYTSAKAANVAGAGGSTPFLLWNRSLSVQTNFSVYTSSTMATPATEIRVYSLLCLSCHDGVSAMNVMYNYPGSGTTPLVPDSYTYMAQLCNADSITGWACNIGDRMTTGDILNLSNDHPISFDYTATHPDTQGTNPGLRTPSIGYANSTSIRLFYNPNTGLETSMECSTCHDPHSGAEGGTAQDVNDAKHPLLVMSKSNSMLCLNCHIK